MGNDSSLASFLFKTKIKNMIKCAFHVEQRLFLKLLTPSVASAMSK